MKKVITSLVLVLIVVGAVLFSVRSALNKRGMFRQFHEISTAFEPANLELYRSLLPQPLEMPGRPVVAMFVIDYVEVFPWPMTRYQEGAVALRCKYNGEEGWHVKTMPVTKWVPNWGGRFLGFPKYVADEITLQSSGQSWKGEVKQAGETRLALEFTSENMRELTTDEKEFMESGAAQLKEPLFLFVPPDKGPTLQKVMVVQTVEPQWTAKQGMVKITIAPKEPWAGLLPAGSVAPGLFQEFTGGAILVPTKLK
jgi:Acetoacetate decarboxylase (ADC).